MAIANEIPTGRPELVTSREPVGPRVAGDKGSAGSVAFNDAVIIIGIAWLVLAVLMFSLRAHNI